MARRIPRGVLAGGIVAVAVLGTLVAVYITVLAPQLKARRKARYELKEAKERLAQIQKDFGQHQNPEAELKLLRQEVAELEQAVTSMRKITQARLPSPLMPEELDTPDKAQLLRRYREHLEDLAEGIKEQVEEAYSEKRVVFDRAIKFPYDVDRLGQAKHKKANLLVQKDIALLLLESDIFALRRMEASPPQRRGDLLRFEYEVVAEISPANLVRFVYLLREQPAYYYLESINVAPVSTNRGGTYFDPAEEVDLRMVARIGTVRSQSEVESPEDRREKVKELAEKRAAQEAALETNPWVQTLKKLEDPTADKSEFGEQKPWWKFW